MEGRIVKSPSVKRRRLRRVIAVGLFGLAGVALCLAGGGGYRPDPTPPRFYPVAQPETESLPGAGSRTILLNGFIVPLRENRSFDFVVLSFAIVARGEVVPTEAQILRIRGRVYDEMRRHIGSQGAPVPPAVVKGLLLEAIRADFPSEDPWQVYVTEYFAL